MAITTYGGGPDLVFVVVLLSNCYYRIRVVLVILHKTDACMYAFYMALCAVVQQYFQTVRLHHQSGPQTRPVDAFIIG